jgi:hypothetical protein
VSSLKQRFLSTSATCVAPPAGLPQARQAWRQALAIYDDIGHPGADKVRAKLTGTMDREMS